MSISNDVLDFTQGCWGLCIAHLDFPQVYSAFAHFHVFRSTHVGLCRRRRQADGVDLGPHLELLAEHDHGDVVVQRDVVKLRVDVNLLGAVRSEIDSEVA